MISFARVAKKIKRREEEPPDVGRDVETVGIEEGDLALSEEDVRKGVVDGMSSIEFSDKVYALIKESMSTTLMVKLLGRRIGYNALWNKVCSLWKPTMRFHLMDIDNVYYLVKFESALDYNNVIFKGHWVVFGHYLSVQPWLAQFSTMEDFPKNVMTWARIICLFGYFYKRSILHEIGNMIGKVIKIDIQTDKRSTGQFARFAVQMEWMTLRSEFLAQVCWHSIFMKSDIIVWNCQDTGHPNFHRFLKEYLREFDLRVVVLVETRVSRVKVDKVIKNIGMVNSHRVETCGFSRGI
ncbi:hypothetical protein J1N35_012123 [Gossypium stocksii]|uniref:DUF4283 domain-containing protein n=1 Tax=Gossypium stocksii TaxID=47602 RepID=A0A9D3W5R2_9ROSI|nr:hypothetical protein J1N35_012123 [Gossypium stocksii]